MNGVPRRYLVAAVVIVLALPAAWVLFPRKPHDVGLQLARSGKRIEALTIWEKACDAGDVDSCAEATLMRVSRGEIETAKALLAKAKAASPKHVRVMLLEGSFLELEGKPDDAKAVYEEAERLHPDSGLPATGLAKLALAKNDLPEAERCTERALAADPHLGTAHAMRGRIMIATSSLDEAMASYVEAIELDGMAPIDWVSLADVVAVAGRPEDRLAILEDAVVRHPDSHLILVPLGIERANHGDVDRGVEALRVACEIAPDIAEPRIALGILFLQMGNMGFAVSRLEEARKIEPGNLEAAHFLATAWANMDERDKALPLIAEILARTDLDRDQRVRTLFLRARLYEHEGKSAEAMADVRKLLELEPQMPEGNWLLGHLELEAGQLQEAGVHLANALNPKLAVEPVVLQDLARVAARQERYEDALDALEALAEMKALSTDWIKANPEFRALERNEKFRLLMEGAAAAPVAPDIGP